jgi:hypothetical protein
MLSTNGIVITLIPLCSLDSALLDTIKIFIGSLEKVSNLMAKTWYSRAWPEKVHQLLNENRFTPLELDLGRISLPDRLQDNYQIIMLILVALYFG